MATGGALIGALRVTLGLDSANFEAGSRRARDTAHRDTTAMQKSFGGLKTAAAGALAALSGAEMVSAARKAFDYADAIVDLSDRTGASTKLLQEFRYAAQMSGSGVETADDAIGKFTKALGLAEAGGAAQIKMLERLGVTSTNVDTAFRQALDGLAKLPTVSERNAVAMQLFGKSAATLTALIGEGSAGFNELAQRAGELGIVLEDDLLRSAGGVNDKLDTMKMILDAKFAKAIVENADSLLQLANGFANVVGWAGQAAVSIRDFLKAAAQRADAIDGWGADGQARDGDAALRARARYFRRNLESDPSLQPKAVTPKPVIPVVTGGRLPTTAAKPDKPEKPKPDRSAEYLERYNRDLDRLKDGELAAQLNLTTDIGKRAEIEAARAALDRKQFAADIAKQQKDGELTAAQAKALQDQYDANYRLESRAAIWAGLDEEARRQLDIETTAVTIAAERLHEQAGMARTSEDRRRIELQLLDLAVEQAKIDARRVLESNDANEAQREEARMRLAGVEKVRAAGTARIMRDTAGPMGQFLDAMPRGAAELNEAYQRVATDGLAALNDGLTDAIMRSRTFGEVWANVKDQIIAGLIQIAVQQAFIKPLAGLLGGGLSSLTALLGGGSGVGSAAAGLFANAPTSLGLGNNLIPMASGLIGLDNGGSLIGGIPGVDQNVLAINGIPRARVSAHERINITPVTGKSAVRGGDNFYFNGVMTTDQFWAEIDKRDAAAGTAASIDTVRTIAKGQRKQMGTGRR